MCLDAARGTRADQRSSARRSDGTRAPFPFVIRSTISAMTGRAASVPVPGTPSARHWPLRGTERMPVALVGDGDFLMGVTALWTAVHHRIPVLVMVANNSSYFVDEEHQRTVSRQRKRSLDNAWIGQRLEDPMIDLEAMARAQGCTAERVERRSELTAAIAARHGGCRCGQVPCHRCADLARLHGTPWMMEDAMPSHVSSHQHPRHRAATDQRRTSASSSGESISRSRSTITSSPQFVRPG